MSCGQEYVPLVVKRALARFSSQLKNATYGVKYIKLI